MVVLESPVPPNRTLAEVARERNLHPVEAMIQLAVETDLQQLFWQTFVPISYDDTAELLRNPHVLMAFSDSGAHMSQMADASVHTHLLAYWVRKRNEFTFEQAVRMMTLIPSRMWGLHDRGLVREGMVADLNVIDPDVVAPAMPHVVHDLPAGEARMEQRSVGIGATLVAGEVTVRDGEHTGRFPGALLRRKVPQR
jgi:N-acyl-D-aspartate/D-glutamate deacylase